MSWTTAIKVSFSNFISFGTTTWRKFLIFLSKLADCLISVSAAGSVFSLLILAKTCLSKTTRFASDQRFRNKLKAFQSAAPLNTYSGLTRYSISTVVKVSLHYALTSVERRIWITRRWFTTSFSVIFLKFEATFKIDVGDSRYLLVRSFSNSLLPCPDSQTYLIMLKMRL